MGDEDKKKGSSGKSSSSSGSRQWTMYDFIAYGLWAVVAIGFVYGASKAFSKKAPASGLRTATSVGLSESAAAESEETTLAELPAARRATGRRRRTGRSLRTINPKIGAHASLEGNSLLDLDKITWEDIQSATEEHIMQALALYLFAEPEQDLCKFTWLPRNRADMDGAWPLCAEVPRPIPSRCHMYSIGVGANHEFDVSGATELGCNVRSFDPDITPLTGLPHGVAFEPIGMAGNNNNLQAAEHKTATLSTLMSIKHEQGRHLYIIKTDCEGCEWESFAQQLQDLGPDAFHDFDQVLIETHIGFEGWNPQRAMALVALLYNQDFHLYWKKQNPWSVGKPGTAGLLRVLQELYGKDKAESFRASKETFLNLGEDGNSYKEGNYNEWKEFVHPEGLMCCYEQAWVRAESLPHNVTLVPKEHMACIPP